MLTHICFVKTDTFVLHQMFHKIHNVSNRKFKETKVWGIIPPQGGSVLTMHDIAIGLLYEGLIWFTVNLPFICTVRNVCSIMEIYNEM